MPLTSVERHPPANGFPFTSRKVLGIIGMGCTCAIADGAIIPSTMLTTNSQCLHCKRMFIHHPCYKRRFCSKKCYWESGNPRGPRGPLIPLEERFWTYVYKTWNCWFWIGSANFQGYGKLTVRKTTIPAPRISWEIHFGPIPQGRWVLHSCDTPQCVRPDHLFLGDNSANMFDAVAKGRKHSPNAEPWW